MNTLCWKSIAISVACAVTLSYASDSVAQVLRKVGLLSPATEKNPVQLEFDRRLAAAGWVPGKNVVIIYKSANGRNDALPALAAELVRESPDVIVTFGTPASFAAKAATTTIPVVFASVGDPVGVGLAPALARPSGNITGISGVTLALTAKRLELLRELLPGLRNVALLLNPSDPTADRVAEAGLAGARSLNLKVEIFHAARPADLGSAFEAIKQSGASAVLLQPDGMFWTFREDIARLAASKALPAMYGFAEHVAAGGLMSYGASFFGEGGMLAKCVDYVDRILKGARPADLPIQEPTEFELVLNKGAAAALRLSIPQAVLLRASRVVE